MNSPSTAEFLKVAAYIIIFGYLWRVAASRMADRPIGKAMGTIY